MALELDVKSMNWNEHSREYETEVMLGDSDTVYRYGITFNGSNVHFNSWLSPKNRLSILDLNDCPFNGEKPSIRLCPYNERSEERIKEAYKALHHFIKTKCSEET
jgi:hypothetical protein